MFPHKWHKMRNYIQKLQILLIIYTEIRQHNEEKSNLYEVFDFLKLMMRFLTCNI
jgi:hypothetical protein